MFLLIFENTAFAFASSNFSVVSRPQSGVLVA